MVKRHTWVNHGRWLTSCACGEYVDARAETVQCPVCRRLIDPVFPANRQEGQRLLDRRPLVNQNWTPSLEAAALNGTLTVETLDDLHKENEKWLG